MSKWHNTREYRMWRAKIIRRDKTCLICGSIKNRRAHHINSGSYFPEDRYREINGVCLCEKHHKLFHTSYKNSFREKCTKKDFSNFLEFILKFVPVDEDCGITRNKIIEFKYKLDKQK